MEDRVTYFQGNELLVRPKEATNRHERRRENKKPKKKNVPMNGKWYKLGHRLCGHQRKDFIQIAHIQNLRKYEKNICNNLTIEIWNQ